MFWYQTIYMWNNCCRNAYNNNNEEKIACENIWWPWFWNETFVLFSIFLFVFRSNVIRTIEIYVHEIKFGKSSWIRDYYRYAYLYIECILPLFNFSTLRRRKLLNYSVTCKANRKSSGILELHKRLILYISTLFSVHCALCIYGIAFFSPVALSSLHVLFLFLFLFSFERYMEMRLPENLWIWYGMIVS